MTERDQYGNLDLDAYRNAYAGIGPLAYDWTDKPHRLVWDLVAEVRRVRAELAALQQRIEALCGEADGRPGFSSVWTHQLRAALAGPAPAGPCETCSGTGTVECWNPGGPCPAPPCESCGQCLTCGAAPAEETR